MWQASVVSRSLRRGIVQQSTPQAEGFRLQFAIPRFAGLIHVAALLLTACTQAPADAPAERIALDQIPANAPLPPPAKQPDGAVWAVSGAQSLSFGAPGSAALLMLECRVGAGRIAALRYTRLDAADPGAEALFALVGANGIARLPVEAEQVAGGWHWSGDLPAADPRLEVFAGPATATLPGAGMLDLPASALPASLIAACRRAGVPDPASTQSLPNLPSNPAVSPAAR